MKKLTLYHFRTEPAEERLELTLYHFRTEPAEERRDYRGELDGSVRGWRPGAGPARALLPGDYNCIQPKVSSVLCRVMQSDRNSLKIDSFREALTSELIILSLFWNLLLVLSSKSCYMFRTCLNVWLISCRLIKSVSLKLNVLNRVLFYCRFSVSFITIRTEICFTFEMFNLKCDLPPWSEHQSAVGC